MSDSPRNPLQKHWRGFTISDPPSNTGEDSEFLTPKQHRKFRISEPPNNTGEDSEFLTPKKHKRFRISDPPNNAEDSRFLIHKQYRKVFNRKVLNP